MLGPRPRFKEHFTTQNPRPVHFLRPTHQCLTFIMERLTYYADQAPAGNHVKGKLVNQVRYLCKAKWDGCTIAPVNVLLEHKQIQRVNTELAEFVSVRTPTWAFHNPGFYIHVINKHARRRAAEAVPSQFNSSVFVSAFILETILKAVLYTPTLSQYSPVQNKLNEGISYYIYRKFEFEIGHCGAFGKCIKWVKLIILVPYGTNKITLKTMFPVFGPPRNPEIVLKPLHYNLKEEVTLWPVRYHREYPKSVSTPESHPTQWPEIGACIIKI